MNKFEIFFPGDFGGFHMKGTEKEISKLICVFACFNINTEILWDLGNKIIFTNKKNRVWDFIGDWTVNFSWTLSIWSLIFVQQTIVILTINKMWQWNFDQNRKLVSTNYSHGHSKVYTQFLRQQTPLFTITCCYC